MRVNKLPRVVARQPPLDRESDATTPHHTTKPQTDGTSIYFIAKVSNASCICQLHYHKQRKSLTVLPDSRVNARAHAFPVRVVTVWNRLPADVVRSSSLLAFKK